MAIDLVYFDGCPHVDMARRNIEAALLAQGLPLTWQEHNVSDPAVGAEWLGYPSPTVLVDGQDVTGSTAISGNACRAGGAPRVGEIAARLGSR
jgi:hypothetical protein